MQTWVRMIQVIQWMTIKQKTHLHRHVKGSEGVVGKVSIILKHAVSSCAGIFTYVYVVNMQRLFVSTIICWDR